MRMQNVWRRYADSLLLDPAAPAMGHSHHTLQWITVAVLGLGGGQSDSMQMAARWLAQCGAAAKGIDHYRVLDGGGQPLVGGHCPASRFRLPDSMPTAAGSPMPPGYVSGSADRAYAAA